MPNPINIQDACSKNYVDNLFNDPSIIKNTEHVDLKGRNITNARFIQVNQLPQIDSHLTAKLYVDNAIDESALVRNNQDNDFNNYNQTNKNSIALKTQAVSDNQVITKPYVDQFHNDNERTGRDLGLDFYDESSYLVKNNQDNDLNDNNLPILNSIKVNRDPTSDNELAIKKNVDDPIEDGTILRFYQKLENCLKISVGNDTYNLTKNKKTQLTDTTTIKNPNSGGYLLPGWEIFCNDRNKNGKIQNFIKSTKTNSPSSHSGATALLPIGNAFMYIETSSNNHGNNVFVSFERIDQIQITNITFYCKRFSILTDDKLKSVGRFRIQLLFEENTWNTRYNITDNDRQSDTSTDWIKLGLNFTVVNYGNKLVLDEIDTAHSNLCFSNITITHSLY